MHAINKNIYSTRHRFIVFSALVAVLLACLFLRVPSVNAAACTAPSTDYGSATSIISVPTSSTYRIWSRIMAPDSTNNSYLLEIDGNTCYTVGDSAITANSWIWVDYQNGSTSSKISAVLTAGNHTFKMIGREAGVKLDRIVLTTDTSCVPTGVGDNCANPPDTTLPVASITQPAQSASVSNTVTVNATASDDSGTVSKTELWVDGALVGTPDTTTPYSFSWNTTSFSNGNHSLVVKAYDPSGNVGLSSAVTVTVSNAVPDTTPPTTNITVPTSGATLAGTANITASANDNLGVTKVEFYRGVTLVGTDTTSPYSISWNTTAVANGSYSLTTKAYDAANNITTSTAVSVTVDNTSPTTAITAPANATNLSGTTNVTATSSDNVAVTKVELYIDGNIGATDLASPYIFGLNTTLFTNGTHTLTTKAYDAAGNVTTSSSVSVVIDNIVPAVSITTPSANAALSKTATVTASASDNVGVSRVEFYVNNGLTNAADTVAPYSFSWNTAAIANGTHTLTTKAYDAAGNVTTSSSVSVTVDNSAPTTAISTPSAGTTVSGSTTINASASDNNAVTKVEFYNGAALLGSDASSPYSFSWNTAAIANGSYSLTTKAYDAAGNVTTSSSVSVTVNNTVTPPPDTAKPTININNPANASTVVGSIPVTITASDNVGVTKVEFYIDTTTTPTNTDTTPSYGFTWDTTTLTDGAHTLKAIAYDAANNSQVSTVSITVNNAPAPKAGDVNNDGVIDGRDLSRILFNWGKSGQTKAQGDIARNDGVINVFDLSILLFNWGK